MSGATLADPSAAHRANPADLHTSAIVDAFERLRFISCEAKTGKARAVENALLVKR
jgi:hypothetical protein